MQHYCLRELCAGQRRRSVLVAMKYGTESTMLLVWVVCDFHHLPAALVLSSIGRFLANARVHSFDCSNITFSPVIRLHDANINFYHP